MSPGESKQRVFLFSLSLSFSPSQLISSFHPIYQIQSIMSNSGKGYSYTSSGTNSQVASPLSISKPLKPLTDSGQPLLLSGLRIRRVQLEQLSLFEQVGRISVRLWPSLINQQRLLLLFQPEWQHLLQQRPRRIHLHSGREIGIGTEY